MDEDSLSCKELDLYCMLWQWEIAHGRNRWKALVERGGEVTRVWATDVLIVNEYSLGDFRKAD